MKKGIKDKLSFAAVFIRLLYDSTCLATGSAFLWRHSGKLYLVSNWHNFTGRDPITRKPASAHAGTPNKVECSLPRNRLSNGAQAEGYIWDQYTFPLIDENNNPLFIEHPMSNHVDIAALVIEPHEYVTPFPLNEQEYEEDIGIYPGQEVFIVGFPLGLIAGQPAPLPIWKRGTIASEPDVPIDGMAKLLIDTATRKGMSGSFVIAQHTGIHSPSGNLADPNSWIGSGRKILGIYSGRIGKNDFEAQLGIVWHKHLIEQTIVQGVTPTF